MPKVSKRAHLMPESPIRKLAPFALEAEKKGVHIHHLNIGQPDIASPKNALDSIKKHKIETLSYAPSNGFESYRNKLSKYYQEKQIKISPEEIIITTGGSEALSFAVSCVCDPGDEVIIPEPYYANYLGFSTSAGVNVLPLTCSLKEDFALPASETIKSLISEKTKAIILCNPGNPTGRLYDNIELERIRSIAIEHDLYVISDEVYREFAYDGKKHKSILSLEGMEENGILIDSVSKRYSLCGARIGLVASKNKIFMNSAMKFAQARLSPPTLAQIVSEAALETDKNYFTKVIDEYISRRNYMVNRLNKIPGVKCSNPSGAFYCVAELPINNSDHFCQWMLKDYEFRGETVMLAPCTGFYSNQELGRMQVRLAYVLKIKELQRAMDCLEHGLKKYRESTHANH